MRYTDETDDAIGGVICLTMILAATVAWGWAGLTGGLAFLLVIRTINGVR